MPEPAQTKLREKRANSAPGRRTSKSGDIGGRGSGATGAGVPALELENAGLGYVDRALRTPPVPLKVEGGETAAPGPVAQSDKVLVPCHSADGARPRTGGCRPWVSRHSTADTAEHAKAGSRTSAGTGAAGAGGTDCGSEAAARAAEGHRAQGGPGWRQLRHGRRCSQARRAL